MHKQQSAAITRPRHRQAVEGQGENVPSAANRVSSWTILLTVATEILSLPADPGGRLAVCTLSDTLTPHLQIRIPPGVSTFKVIQTHFEKPDILSQGAERLFLTPSEPEEECLNLGSPLPAFERSARFPFEVSEGEQDNRPNIMPSESSRHEDSVTLAGPSGYKLFLELPQADPQLKVCFQTTITGQP